MIDPGWPPPHLALNLPGDVWGVLRAVLDWSDNNTRHLLQWTGDLFERQGYLVTFLGVLLENTLFFGFLVPGALILIVAGMAAENGDVSLALVAAAGLGGALIGDTLSYLSGRHLWSRAFGTEAFMGFAARIREPLERNSAWMVLSYHFAGYTRVVGPTAAGLFRLPLRRWLPYDYAGAAAWVAAYLAAGYVLAIFGIDLDAAKRNVRLLDLGALLLVLVAGGVLLRNVLQKRDRVGRPAAVQSSEERGS